MVNPAGAVMDYEVTSPEGHKFIVSAPEGATQDAILSYAKQNFPKPPTLDVFRNALYKGAASIPDALLNTPNRVLNLGKAAVGTGATALGRPDLAPDLNPDPDFVRRGLKSVGIINNVEPQTGPQKAIDVLTQGAVGGALTGGGGLANTLTGAGMGAVSTGAAAATQEATGRPELAMLAGLAAPAGASTVKSALEAGAHRLMQSAIKPAARDLRGVPGNTRADRAIQTMLDEGVNATPGGINTLNQRIGGMSDDIDSAIRGSTATIDKSAVADRLRGTLSQFQSQVNPNADVSAIQKAWTEFLLHPGVPGNSMPVQLAQELKKGTYRQLDKKYGEMGSADIESQKALARGLKEEISQAVPEVSGLNSQEAALINARNVAERRSAMEGNKDILGLSPLASHPTGAIAFMLGRSPLAKSLLARALNAGSKLAPGKADMGRVTIPLSNELSEEERRRMIDALRN